MPLAPVACLTCVLIGRSPCILPDIPSLRVMPSPSRWQRLEIHHTPKHGSWLNIAEIELSALSRQCLDRRISDLDTLNAELAAWQHAINAEQRQVRWQFTTDDARVKLRHLYPKS